MMHALTREIRLGDIDYGCPQMDRRYSLLGQNGRNDRSFLQGAASLKRRVSVKIAEAQRGERISRQTNLQQREDDAFEEGGWLVHSSYERFVIVYIEFIVVRNVYPDSIQ
jgi:hypothetical protein